MILITKICPLCDKVLYPNPSEDGDKELLIHVKEHHHIDEKRYYKIIAALYNYEELHNILNDILKSYTDFVEDVHEIRRNKEIAL